MSRQISWFGIDFGTTNSAIYSISGADAESMTSICYGDPELMDGLPLPSLVGINKVTGEVITGRGVRDKRNELSKEYEFFSSIKTIIDQKKVFHIAGKDWTPIDIATEIFKSLRQRVREYTKGTEDCREAVIAVPVGFSTDKKRSLREAANKAGIKVKTFISEPTAAYISNYVNLRGNKYVAVFDWGGGTLDISILKIEKGCIYEMATNGMAKAGDAIDLMLADKAHSNICKKKNISINFEDLSAETRDLLIGACEKAKINFSDGDDFQRIRVGHYDDYGTAITEMTYELFSDLISPLVDDAVRLLKNTIIEAGLNIANIDYILCVGGSSKLRPLRDRLAQEFGKDLVYYPQQVMWDIANGAAVVNMSSGAYKLNQDIGLILNDGDFYPLIEHGQKIPCQEKNIDFAITTDEKQAKFIVTDAKDPEKRTFTQFITVPSGGFMAEEFEVSCYIDPDLLFRLRIRSTQFMHQYLQLWTYDRLRISYQIEG